MKIFIGLLVWIIIFLLLFIPLGILSIVKLLIVVYHTRRGRRATSNENGVEEKLFPMSASDSMFSVGHSWEKSIVPVGFVLKLAKPENESNTLTIDKLREHFSKCFLEDGIEGGKYDKFFCYVQLFSGYPFHYYRNAIDISDHIYQLKYDDFTNKTPEGVIADWLLTKYKEKKPCWEMILLQGDNTKNFETIVAFKCHHSLMDGYSLIHVLDKLCGNSSPYLVKDFNDSLLTQMKQIIECPAHLSRVSGITREKNPFCVTLSKQHEWMISFTSFPLAELKEFRRKHDVHMTSVILTILVLALLEFKEKEMSTEFTTDLFDQLCLPLTLPWPRHPSRDASVPNRDKLCNHWSSTLLKISIKDRSPLHMLKSIENEHQTILKLGLDRSFKRSIMPLFGLIPITVIGNFFAKNDPGMGPGITSLIGGDNYSLLGHPVEHIHPFVMAIDNVPYCPFSCFSFSHSGKMDITFGAHPSVVKDQNTLDKILNDCHKQKDILLSS